MDKPTRKELRAAIDKKRAELEKLRALDRQTVQPKLDALYQEAEDFRLPENELRRREEALLSGTASPATRVAEEALRKLEAEEGVYLDPYMVTLTDKVAMGAGRVVSLQGVNGGTVHFLRGNERRRNSTKLLMLTTVQAQQLKEDGYEVEPGPQLGDVQGVGPATAEKLNEAGIASPADLASAQPEVVAAAVGEAKAEGIQEAAARVAEPSTNRRGKKR